jgi:hypothetical protein
MIFENPLGLLGLLLIPIIIILHRLRQRPPRQNISSLFIWKQIEQYLTSKPLRKKSYLYLILLLQILTVICLSFALATPIWKITKSQPPHLIFLIDNSASMGSIYNDSGQKPITRWELLLAKIKKVIEDTPTDSTFSFYQSKMDMVLRNLKRNPALNAIYKLKLLEIPSDIESLVQETKNIKGEVYFCSDKMPSESILKELGQRLHLILVGQPSHNKAITRAASTRVSDKENYYNIFAVIKDYSPGSQVENVSVDLIGLTQKGEKTLGHQETNLKAGEETNVIFKNIYLEKKILLKIILNVNDEMECDNKVWLTPSKDITIAVVNKDNPSLMKALRANPIVSVDYRTKIDAYNIEMRDGTIFYNIYIFNEILFGDPPYKSVVINAIPYGTPLNRIPSGIPDNTDQNRFWKYEGKISNPVITKIDTTSPILQYCDTGIFTRIPYALEVTPIEIEYFKPIIQAKGANGEDCVLLGEWQKGNRQLIIINFPIDWRTDINPNDWTSTPSFPIFWTNLINYLWPESESKLNNYILYRTGEAVEGNIYFNTGWYYYSMFSDSVGMNLCDDKESDNNGISVMDTARPSAERLPEQEVKMINLNNWLIFAAGILLLSSWLLRKSPDK